MTAYDWDFLAAVGIRNQQVGNENNNANDTVDADDDEVPTGKERITIQAAQDIAERDLGAREIDAHFVSDSGIEHYNGRRVWELEFISRGQTIKYYIDVETGDILKYEMENDD